MERKSINALKAHNFYDLFCMFHAASQAYV